MGNRSDCNEVNLQNDKKRRRYNNIISDDLNWVMIDSVPWYSFREITIHNVVATASEIEKEVIMFR